MPRAASRFSADRITQSPADDQRVALEEVARLNGATLSFVARHALEQFIKRCPDGQLPLGFPVSEDGPLRSDHTER